MSEKFTAGDWRIGPSGIIRAETTYADGTRMTRWVAEILECAPAIPGESDANARLISAAPEMAKALEDVPLPSTQGGWSEFLPRFYHWYNGQRALAVAKATEPIA